MSSESTMCVMRLSLPYCDSSVLSICSTWHQMWGSRQQGGEERSEDRRRTVAVAIHSRAWMQPSIQKAGLLAAARPVSCV